MAVPLPRAVEAITLRGEPQAWMRRGQCRLQFREGWQRRIRRRPGLVIARIAIARIAVAGIAVAGIAVAGIASAGIAIAGIAIAGIAIAGIAIAGIAADGRLLLAAAVTTAASLQGGGADRADQENAQHAQCRGKETNSHGNLQAPFGMPGVKSGHAFPASRERLIFTGMKKGALRRLVSSLISTGSVPA